MQLYWMGSNQHCLDNHKQTKATSLENNIKWKQKYYILEQWKYKQLVVIRSNVIGSESKAREWRSNQA